jgi:hypothetical protein
MTKEEQKELLSDLCSRLPYGVKLQILSWDDVNMEYVDKADTLYSISSDNHVRTSSEDRDFYIDEVKPYLFPMSSMTEEQRKEYEDAITYHGYIDGGWAMVKDFANEYVAPYWFVDFCNKNHLDYRGWINVGLAIDATGKNIY